MQNQAFAFIVFILNGFIIGILFDVFRILRKSFKTPDFITCFEDIAFWIISGFILLYSIFKFNNGELRFFIFLGIFIGISIYLLIFSKLFIKVSIFIIEIIKKLVHTIIIVPAKFIIKTFKIIIINPILHIIKKVFYLKSIQFITINLKKLTLNHRIFKKKKDFA